MCKEIGQKNEKKERKKVLMCKEIGQKNEKKGKKKGVNV